MRLSALGLLLTVMTSAIAADAADAVGTVERIQVHGKSLEGNLEGDSPDREVCVYLPPSYATAQGRRYPVIYLLHGFTDNTENWWFKPHFINVPDVANKAIQSGASREMIIVMPNAFTRYQGSMYSSSATVGDWETFVSSELVSYIDGHYRTLARRESRGLAGHSMGGYGTIRIGMKHPEVFSSLYILSPCCMAPPTGKVNPNWSKAEKMQSPDEIGHADFPTKAAMASAAAWSPNPGRAPFYFDLPSRDGEYLPEIGAKWAANAPLAMIDQYIGRLKQLRGLAVDAGAQDASIAETVRTLDKILTSYKIEHFFEIYEGTHTSRIAERVETKVLPFFSQKLEF